MRITGILPCSAGKEGKLCGLTEPFSCPVGRAQLVPAFGFNATILQVVTSGISIRIADRSIRRRTETLMKNAILFLSIAALSATGCAWGHKQNHQTYGGPPYGPAHDRPFPVGPVSDSHWETQQTTAQAADLVFYEHECRYDTTKHVETAQLSRRAKKH